MTLLDLYLLGCALAFGSAMAAFSRGEMGIVGRWVDEPPVWLRLIEVAVAVAGSWCTVGFCQVQNAYRASGR